jgi:hypothetical protein
MAPRPRRTCDQSPESRRAERSRLRWATWPSPAFLTLPHSAGDPPEAAPLFRVAACTVAGADNWNHGLFQLQYLHGAKRPALHRPQRGGPPCPAGWGANSLPAGPYPLHNPAPRLCKSHVNGSIFLRAAPGRLGRLLPHRLVSFRAHTKRKKILSCFNFYADLSR